MHILEDHVVQWMEKWKVASGLMGEQGMEQIHSHIHRLEKTYCGVTNPLHRLTYVMREHLLQTAPALSTLEPAPKKRKTSSY